MDLLDFSRIFFALIAVLALIGLCAFLARKAGLAQNAIALHRRRRLQTVEQIALDARRRAVILRCDGREHLIVLGPTGETVIDRDIPPAPPVEIVSPAAAELPNFAEAFARLRKRAAAPQADAA